MGEWNAFFPRMPSLDTLIKITSVQHVSNYFVWKVENMIDVCGGLVLKGTKHAPYHGHFADLTNSRTCDLAVCMWNRKATFGRGQAEKGGPKFLCENKDEKYLHYMYMFWTCVVRGSCANGKTKRDCSAFCSTGILLGCVSI